MLTTLVPPLFAVLFGATGLASLLGTDRLVSKYLRWNYPPRNRHKVGALEIIASVLIALEASRTYGLTLAVFLTAGAVILLLYQRMYWSAAAGIGLQMLLAFNLLAWFVT